MKDNLELERSDICVDRDMEIDPDNSFHLRVYLETWFDVEKKFDLIPWEGDEKSVDLYAIYNPLEDHLVCEYVIKDDHGEEYVTYEPTENEAKLIKGMIAETIMEEHGKTPEAFVCELEDFDYSLICQ
ncbi:MAG: hypothetical protein J6Q78_02715 [Clostridia bacterium]|nr:hypothetical protein [Clostridia bacterium]